jgi:hypothetical protein
MENTERERILEASKTNVALRRLYEEHQRLEEALEGFEKRKFMTSVEEIEAKKLKLKKLKGKERIMAMISEERPQAP